MNIKKLFLAIILFGFNLSNSQIIFTQVYYDSPYQETIFSFADQQTLNQNNYYHHWGEFIEIYNYSDEDIPLDGWAIADNISNYRFPVNAVIKSGQLIVVVYKEANDPNYFTNFFPNTIGKESQIFYQDQVMLRNGRESLKLIVGKIRGINVNFSYSDSLSWFTSDSQLNYGIHNEVLNVWNQASNNYNNFNFYVNSLQLLIDPIANEITFGPSIANPLEGNYLPPIQQF